MKKIILSIALLGGALGTSHIQAQTVLEALEGGIPFTPSEKCLERVYDKHYGDGEHNFIYCAVQGPNGKKWLNLNLGAEYAREASEHFNPEAVPTDNHDWKAFGNLFNYNRNADGHELVNWSIGTERWEVVHTNGYRKSYNAVTARNSKSVNTDRPDPLRDMVAGWTEANDPCPSGYRVMEATDLTSSNPAKFHWEGPPKSATILKSTDASYWNLMVSPGWALDYSTAVGNEAKIVTTSGIPGKDGGSAVLWIKSAHKVEGTNGGDWEPMYETCEMFNYSETCLNRMQQYILDRGIFKGFSNQTLIYEFGFLGLVSAASIRCVEK